MGNICARVQRRVCNLLLPVSYQNSQVGGVNLIRPIRSAVNITIALIPAAAGRRAPAIRLIIYEIIQVLGVSTITEAVVGNVQLYLSYLRTILCVWVPNYEIAVIIVAHIQRCDVDIQRNIDSW